MTGFEWTEKREMAARLCAEGAHTYEAMASSVDVSVDTLGRWREHPEFQERIKILAQKVAGDLDTYARGSQVSAIQRSQEIVDGLWDVAKNDRNGAARVAALNSLARIAGLLPRGQAGGDSLNVTVSNSMNVSDDEHEVMSTYEYHVRRDLVTRTDIE